jgi:hypothetical protein
MFVAHGHVLERGGEMGYRAIAAIFLSVIHAGPVASQDMFPEAYVEIKKQNTYEGNDVCELASGLFRGVTNHAGHSGFVELRPLQ